MKKTSSSGDMKGVTNGGVAPEDDSADSGGPANHYDGTRSRGRLRSPSRTRRRCPGVPARSTFSDELWPVFHLRITAMTMDQEGYSTPSSPASLLPTENAVPTNSECFNEYTLEIKEKKEIKKKRKTDKA
ncbi:hypothetical protein L1987_02064 [Smallanthus sonchifolius]|uniref:Uncharacterized protein n=1 Tax=Smallanthus sonchifolius TaxID=185202 RepID=A0ACB9K705_9ASTR|nr:hypothetical protein L1987_02064 [Smallanthus sonchifolius]